MSDEKRAVQAGVGYDVAEELAKWVESGGGADMPVLLLLRLRLGVTDIPSAIRARRAAGIAKYGHPLRPDTRRADGSRYDWKREAAEELLDAIIYLTAAEFAEVER